MADGADPVLGFVDLVEVPFTVPGSRFLVVRGSGAHADALEVFHVRYEIPLAECLALRLTPARDLDVPAPVVRAGRVQWAGTELALLDDELHVAVPPGSGVRVDAGPAPDVTTLRRGDTRVLAGSAGPSPLDDDTFGSAADAAVEAWLALTPTVRPERQEMARLCWWVLGANQLDISSPGGDGSVRVIVPSKRGYVALWQWDTYFIALGLRHTAPELALAQLDVALTPAADGQLPDVVHDDGILASSADLPAADRARLEAQGSPTTTSGTVPLTKPPLAAWAADLVLRHVPPESRDAWLREHLDTLVASQDWWFDVCDTDGDGLPEYLHPYSSGLDDSPVYDHALPVLAPDLLAYLAVEDEILAGWVREHGSSPDEPLAARLEARAARTRAGLSRLWDPEGALHRPVAAGQPVPDRTVVSLLGCFAGGLPHEQVDAIVSDVRNPARFGAPYSLPTVSMDDPMFDPLVMWRGPAWVNTAFLVAEGLERCGAPAEAERLREQVLALVEAAGGPVEYADPRTGIRCPTATTAFAWSAALYVDLAVREARATA
jgi:glycogen debranching enzyme